MPAVSRPQVEPAFGPFHPDVAVGRSGLHVGEPAGKLDVAVGRADVFEDGARRDFHLVIHLHPQIAVFLIDRIHLDVGTGGLDFDFNPVQVFLMPIGGLQGGNLDLVAVPGGHPDESVGVCQAEPVARFQGQGSWKTVRYTSARRKSRRIRRLHPRKRSRRKIRRPGTSMVAARKAGNVVLARMVILLWKAFIGKDAKMEEKGFPAGKGFFQFLAVSIMAGSDRDSWGMPK